MANISGIFINEIQHSPSGSPDVNGDTSVDANDEYIELYNSTGSPINLNGWEIYEGANLAHTFGAGDNIPAGGTFTIVDSAVGGVITNVTGASAFSDAGLGIGNGDVISLYDPNTNTYVIVNLGAGNAPLVTDAENAILANHATATQEGTTEITGATVSGQSTQRAVDGGSTFVNETPTAGATNLCFAAGTMIATPEGETAVEALAIGDTILTASGATVPVVWIGRQTSVKAFAGLRSEPVRFDAGSLGDGLPHSDLIVTQDHGMVIDGLVINASALVNGSSIDFVSLAELPERVVYYHIETQAHDVILANGTRSETYVDIPDRKLFDNYAEYLTLYGQEHRVAEMKTKRITSQRLLPNALRTRLGLTEPTEMDLLATG